MMGRLCGLTRAAARGRARQLLDHFELADAGRRKVATYSGGMRRRLDLAASLVGSPSVIFLDEPTTGLDLRGRVATWELITGLAGSGVTIFLTTQYLEEADQLADHIAVLDHGRVVGDGTSSELKSRFAEQRLELTCADGASFSAIAGVLGARAIFIDRERFVLGVATDGGAAHARAVLDEVDPERCRVGAFAVHEATLDDVFMALTGHAAVAEEDEKELNVA